MEGREAEALERLRETTRRLRAGGSLMPLPASGEGQASSPPRHWADTDREGEDPLPGG